MFKSDALALAVPHNAADVDPAFYDLIAFMALDETPIGIAGHVLLRARHSPEFRDDFLAFVRMVMSKGRRVSRPAFELFQQLCATAPN